MPSRHDQLESLAQACGERAWRLARVLMRNDADADDTMQQAFVVAARKAERIPTDDAWPWFARVVTLEARYGRRKRARREWELDMPQAESECPEDQLVRAELVRQVRTALDELPEIEREALVVTHMSGLTYRDAAAALELPVSTLDSRVQKGLDHLRSRLRSTEKSLLACLPLLPVSPPSLGLPNAIKQWLAATEAEPASIGAGSALAASRGGSGMLRMFALGLVLVTALVCLWLWLGDTQATQSTQDARTLSGAGAGSASADGRKTPPSPDAKVDSGTESAGPEAKVVPDSEAAKPRTLTLSGVCLEFVEEGDFEYRMTERPVAGATVWVERVSNRGTPDEERLHRFLRCDAWQPDADVFKTLTAADGTWTIKDIPTEWPGPADADGKKPALAELLISAWHPHCFGWDEMTHAISYDDEGPMDAGAPQGVKTRDAIRFSHHGLSVDLSGPEIKLAQGGRCRMYYGHGANLITFTTPVTIGLRRGATVSGTVFEANGGPAAGVRVAAEHWQMFGMRYFDDWTIDYKLVKGHPYEMEVEFETTTDKEGRYQLLGLHPHADTEILATKAGAHPCKACFDPDGRLNSQLDLYLRPPVKLQGRFAAHAERKSSEGLMLHLKCRRPILGEGGDVKPGEDGSFEFGDLQAGLLYRIEVTDGNRDSIVTTTEWLDLSRGDLRIEIVEPGPALIKVKLSGEPFAGPEDKYLVVLAPAEWFGEHSLASALNPLSHHNAPEQEVAADAPVAAFRYHVRPQNEGEHRVPVLPGAKRVRVVAMPIEFFKSGNHGSDRAKIDQLLSRAQISEPFDAEADKSVEIVLSAVSFWSLELTVRGGGKGRVWLERLPGPGEDAKQAWYARPDSQTLEVFGFHYFTKPGIYRILWSSSRESPGVLLQTVTLVLGETERLSFDAPAQPDSPKDD